MLGTLGQSLPSSPRADLAQAKVQNPDLAVILAAQRRAADAKVDRIPVGLETKYNEFGKMVMEEAQRMVINDLDPVAVAKTMQLRAVEIQKAQ
jgi:multiple sugar transport system substrate-binding protein